MTDVAPQADGETLARRAKGRTGTADGSCDPQIGASVGHLRHLGQDAAGLGEGFVNIPERARTAHAGKVKVGRRLALGDIACAIDPDEKEGHAQRPRPLKRGKPVTDGLEPHPEMSPKPHDVVGEGFGLLKKITIGQQDGAGEVLG